MNKNLEALETLKLLKDFVLENTKNGLDRRFIIGSCDILENELKVLEIIKYKQVNVYSFIQRKPKTFEEYQDIDDEIEQLSEVSLSREEYELLKEVLL